jgi:DNA primase
MPPGEDPDSLVRARGAEAFRAALAKATPLYDLLWRVHVLGRKGGSARAEDFSPEDRAAIDAELDAAAGRIADSRLRYQYRQYFRSRMRAFFAPPGRRPAVVGSARRPFARGSEALVEAAPADPLGAGRQGLASRRELALVRAVVNHPQLLDRLDESFARLRPAAPRLDEMCRKILEVAATTPDLDSAALQRQLRQDGFSDLLDDDLAPRGWGRGSRDFAFDHPDAPLDAVEAGWRDAFARHELAGLEREREAAERELARDMTPQAVANLNAIRQLLEARHLPLPGDAEPNAQG